VSVHQLVLNADIPCSWSAADCTNSASPRMADARSSPGGGSTLLPKVRATIAGAVLEYARSDEHACARGAREMRKQENILEGWGY
jgi:hypothetical protein